MRFYVPFLLQRYKLFEKELINSRILLNFVCNENNNQTDGGYHEKQADYIKRIEIKRLWGRKNISWDLRPDVNILSGINGIGKSTILNNSVRSLNALEGGALTNGAQPGVSFIFSPEDATFIHFDVIRSFDRPLINSGLLEK